MDSKLVKWLPILGGLAAVLGAIVVVMDLAGGHGLLSSGWLAIMVGIVVVWFSLILRRSRE